MSNLTKEELLKIGNDLDEIGKIQEMHSKMRQNRPKRRRKMIHRAYTMCYHNKITKRLKEIMYVFRDDLNEYAEREKRVSLDENGCLVIEVEGEDF